MREKFWLCSGINFVESSRFLLGNKNLLLNRVAIDTNLVDYCAKFCGFITTITENGVKKSLENVQVTGTK